MKITNIFLFLMLTATLTNAQYRFYATNRYDSLAYENNINKNEYRLKQIEFEQYFTNKFFVEEDKHDKEYLLPIQFNVITNGVKTITIKELEKQVEYLNMAFRNRFSPVPDDPYADRAIDTKINFCMYTDGIPNVRYKVIENTRFEDFLSMKNAEKGIDASQNNEKINVWVCELGSFFQGPILRNIAGYSQYPNRDELTDGIVIDIDYLYKEDAQDKTLIHLMGNYLGLLPIWGNELCTEDNIPDTPMNNEESIICIPGNVISTCPPYERRMYGNFMDNGDDNCAWFFTKHQKYRMVANIVFSRKNISQKEETDCRGSNVSNINEEAFGSNELNIFPNPSQSEINIVFSKDILPDSEFQIYNTNGRKIAHGKMSKTFNIDINSFEPGVYLFIYNNDLNYSKKFIRL